MASAGQRTAPSHPIAVRLVTLNIRYATKNPVSGEQPWSIRCPKLCAQLRFITSGHSSVFICIQEALHSQLMDIQASLGSSWSYVGQGRDDGKTSGEFSPIFFRVDSWECQRNKTYWLSQTPEMPSRGWDAALNRIVTMGSFRHNETGIVIIAMSTHLDHRGVVAREESANLLLRLAGEWSSVGGGQVRLPVFLGGDFNSTPNDKAYKNLTSPGSGMRDISDLVPDGLKYGNRQITYTSFGEPNEKPSRIDFLFVQEPRDLEFPTFGILPNRFDDNIYLSDHRPVVADMKIPVGTS
ncbi:Endonuclease/exonuclease/phosphatase [Diplogelasinospora grovesii]|uniref:Endonuclease/exonuclease/phosphatase n=1 Tax=Diplogelasinospora grovesii TaxID=303347 RepID=A0AAN6N970_9PEZI|nr:Endonuclease/exonuclease/phosphatase [Diplogelasinospora grovesii]